MVLIFFLLCTFVTWFKASKEGVLWGFAAAGVLAGLTVLTKEVLSLYFLAMGGLFFLASQKKKKTLCFAAVFLIAYSLCLAPWLIRTQRIHHRLALLTGSTGLTFYLGNNPSVNPRWYGGDWIEGRDTAYPPDPPREYWTSLVKVDRYYLQKALEFIRTQPGRFFLNTVRKMVRLWYPFYDRASLTTKWLTGIFYAVVMGFALAGVFFSRERWRLLLPFYLLIFYVTVIHGVTIPGIRYRYPVMPVLMLFAGYGAHQIWLKVRTKKTRIEAPL